MSKFNLLKECAKVANEKGNLKLHQDHISQVIENTNIKFFVEEQLVRFQPPYCINCPKRRADRVCVYKNCGNNFMQLICGKCHFDVHKQASTKSEIDIEEYFTKLTIFLNSKQQRQHQSQQYRVDTNNFGLVPQIIQQMKEKLNYIKFNLAKEVEGYKSPSEMQEIVENGITNALSYCEVQNIQYQLDLIRKNILYQSNAFLWKDASKRLTAFQQEISELYKLTENLDKTIQKSFIGRNSIELSELQCIKCSILSGNQDQDKIKGKDGQLTISSKTTAQYFLDYPLDKTKKYKLQFSFSEQPVAYLMVGVMPFSMKDNNWVYNIPNQKFSKHFLNNCPITECSRIICGGDLNGMAQKEMKIEIRVDFEEHYIDFADYPDKTNVNASFLDNKFSNNEPYVFAFAFRAPNQLTLEHFEETSSIEKC